MLGFKGDKNMSSSQTHSATVFGFVMGHRHLNLIYFVKLKPVIKKQLLESDNDTL